MKTQKKELPNEFTFVCDEHSREQLEKLGVENLYNYNIIDEAIYGYRFSVKNNLIIWFGGSDFNYPLINLADYLDQEQPEPIGTTPASDSLISMVTDNKEQSYRISNLQYGTTFHVSAQPQTATLEMDSPTTYYPIFFHTEPYKTLLSIQTKPKSEIVFKDKVIAYKQLEQLLLSADLPSKQPEPKWQEKTRGGYEFRIYEEFEGEIFGKLKSSDGEWHGLKWNLDGSFYSSNCEDSWDLLPINHELTTLQKELEEVRLKEKEILEKIEELKK